MEPVKKARTINKEAKYQKASLKLLKEIAGYLKFLCDDRKRQR